MNVPNRAVAMTALATAVILAAGTGTALAAPTTYHFNPGHSYVRFGYEHMGFSHQQQQFDKVSGSVTFDPQAKTGSADVTIDIRSMDTGGSPLAADLQSPAFFDTAQYPTATFKSTAVHFRGDQPVSMDGNLTIKGITHPVTLTIHHFKHGVHPLEKREAIGCDATTVVKRSDFGLSKDVPLVGDQVTITVDFEATAAAAG